MYGEYSKSKNPSLHSFIRTTGKSYSDKIANNVATGAYDVADLSGPDMGKGRSAANPMDKAAKAKVKAKIAAKMGTSRAGNAGPKPSQFTEIKR